LGRGEVLVRGPAIPEGCLGIVLLDAVARLVKLSQLILRLRVACVGPGDECGIDAIALGGYLEEGQHEQSSDKQTWVEEPHSAFLRNSSTYQTARLLLVIGAGALAAGGCRSTVQFVKVDPCPMQSRSSQVRLSILNLLLLML